MKRNQLIKYLENNGCKLLREGARHSWWLNPKLNKHSAVPRHKEIVDQLVNKICKDLGIPKIK